MSELEAFVTINRVGASCGGTLVPSQPAISRRIELLERELGAPLFERLPRGIRLTEAGMALLPYAESGFGVLRMEEPLSTRSAEEVERLP